MPNFRIWENPNITRKYDLGSMLWMLLIAVCMQQKAPLKWHLCFAMPRLCPSCKPT